MSKQREVPHVGIFSTFAGEDIFIWRPFPGSILIKNFCLGFCVGQGCNMNTYGEQMYMSFMTNHVIAFLKGLNEKCTCTFLHAGLLGKQSTRLQNQALQNPATDCNENDSDTCVAVSNNGNICLYGLDHLSKEHQYTTYGRDGPSLQAQTQTNHYTTCT